MQHDDQVDAGSVGLDPAEPALRIQHVSKVFAGTVALDDVSFDVGRGSIHALCGGNGSGKSTLIKILAGVHQALSGTIVVNGNAFDASKANPAWSASVGLHFVHQASGTFPDLTVAENFAFGSTFDARSLAPISWRTLQRRVQRVLDRFELDVSAKAQMGDLSPATQTMVTVARALQDDGSHGPGTLILDEPTASLPVHEAEAVLDAMRGYARNGHTVIFVTHRLGEVLSVADTATFLQDGRHLETRPMRGLDEHGLIERITANLVLSDAAQQRSATLKTAAAPRLVVTDLAVGPVESASFAVGPGEVLGISGLLGSGRSALLKCIFGLQQPRRGLIELDGERVSCTEPLQAVRAGIGYLPADRGTEAAFADLPVSDNLIMPRVRRYWKSMRFARGAETTDTRTMIDQYGVRVAGTDAEFSSMSGGNQQKVILARWLSLDPKLLLLSEPTQGVDVGARLAIHQRIRAAAATGMSVVVISSDAQELSELCDRVVGLQHGRIVGEASGAELTPQRCTQLAYGLTEARAEHDSERTSTDV